MYVMQTLNTKLLDTAWTVNVTPNFCATINFPTTENSSRTVHHEPIDHVLFTVEHLAVLLRLSLRPKHVTPWRLDASLNPLQRASRNLGPSHLHNFWTTVSHLPRRCCLPQHPAHDGEGDGGWWLVGGAGTGRVGGGWSGWSGVGCGGGRGSQILTSSWNGNGQNQTG